MLKVACEVLVVNLLSFKEALSKHKRTSYLFNFFFNFICRTHRIIKLSFLLSIIVLLMFLVCRETSYDYICIC